MNNISNARMLQIEEVKIPTPELAAAIIKEQYEEIKRLKNKCNAIRAALSMAAPGSNETAALFER